MVLRIVFGILLSAVGPAGLCHSTRAAGLLDAAPKLSAEVYGGLENSSSSRFAYVTGVVAFAPRLDAPGWRFRLMMGGGDYDYVSGAVKYNGRVGAAELMPGRMFRRGPLFVKLYGGLHFEHHRLNKPDPGNRMLGSRAGFKALAETWLNLDRHGRRFAALDLSTSTLNRSYGGRLRLGWKPWKLVALGPELRFAGTRSYGEWRTGGFLTLRGKKAALNLSGGYARSFDGKSGAYSALSGEYKF